MNNEQLLHLMSDINDDLIEEASKQPVHKRRGKWLALATSLILIAGIGIALLAWSNSSAAPGPSIVANENSSVITGTSDKYTTLDALLLDISYLEQKAQRGHQEKTGDAITNLSSNYNAQAQAVAGQGYAYHITDKSVMISQLKGENTTTVGSINLPATDLFLYENTLVVLCEENVGENELIHRVELHVYFYDVSTPEQPQLQGSFTQSGGNCGSFIQQGKLWLLSADGQCACGYTGNLDSASYMPRLSWNGQSIEILEEQVHILGEPSRINYVTVSAFDLGSRQRTDTQVFYGNIEDIWIGDGYLSFSTDDTSKPTLPEIYLFATTEVLTYTGKLNLSSLMTTLGMHAEQGDIISCSKLGDRYCLSGILHEDATNSSNSYLVVITLSEDLQQVDAVTSEAMSRSLAIDEIFQEEERQIICYSTITETYQQQAHFAIVSLDAQANLQLSPTDVPADYLDGIDMIFSYGRPYGHLQTLLPMGEGLYLRYSGLPDGLDIYDLSNTQQVKQIYASDGELAENQRFCYQHHIYDKHTVGLVVLNAGQDEDGEINYRQRYLSYSYYIYRVDYHNAQPFTRIAEYSISGYEDVTILSYGEDTYCFSAAAILPVCVSL